MKQLAIGNVDKRDPGPDLGGGGGQQGLKPRGLHNTNFWVKFPIEWYTTLTRSMYIALLFRNKLFKQRKNFYLILVQKWLGGVSTSSLPQGLHTFKSGPDGTPPIKNNI